MRIARLMIAFVAAATLNDSVHAQTVADFYRGKSITMLIGYTSGGGYDIYARVLSKHMGRHIPGNPSIVPQNMPGAGSLRVANFLYNAAPKDGTTIGMFGRGLAVEPLIGASPTQYDGRKFTWLGSGSDQVSLCVTWHSSPVKTWDDMRAKSFTVAGEGSGSDPDMFATMLRNLMGVKLKLVSGYPGGPEMNLAMERGEVDGRCGWSWTSIKITRAEWVADKRINLVLQMALNKNPEIPHVPLIMDLASNERERADPQAGAEPPADGMAVPGAAGHPGRPRAGAARGLRRHHEGSGIHRRSQAAPARGQSDDRRRDRQARRRALPDPAGRHRCHQGRDRGRRAVTSPIITRPPPLTPPHRASHGGRGTQAPCLASRSLWRGHGLSLPSSREHLRAVGRGRGWGASQA